MFFEFLKDRRTTPYRPDLLLAFNDRLYHAYRSDRLPDWRRMGPAFVYLALPADAGFKKPAISFRIAASGFNPDEPGSDYFSFDADASGDNFALEWRSDINAASLYKTAIAASYTAPDPMGDLYLEHLALPFFQSGSLRGIIGAVAYEDIASIVIENHGRSSHGAIKRRTRTRRLDPPFSHIFQKAGKDESKLWKFFQQWTDRRRDGGPDSPDETAETIHSQRAASA